jgi:hypothetical protein
MNYKQEADAAIGKMMGNSNWRSPKAGSYIVVKRVPLGWFPRGTVPYDLFVSKGIAEFEVEALSADQAEALVEIYLREQEEQD